MELQKLITAVIPCSTVSTSSIKTLFKLGMFFSQRVYMLTKETSMCNLSISSYLSGLRQSREIWHQHYR